MTRTTRDYYRPLMCWKCVPVGHVKTPGYCPHVTRPWTRQHNKRPYKYRKGGKHDRVCCGGYRLWPRDLFWLRYDVEREVRELLKG